METPRLILRPWRESDLEPFIQLNQDPRVMEFFHQPLSAEESKALAACVQDHFDTYGYGFWVVELKDRGLFAGIVGLGNVGFEAPFIPCVEIAWRLAPEFWGKGIAFEAAQAALDFAFNQLDLPEIVAFTVPANRRSIALMERLGMSRNPAEDFDHPKVPAGPLQRHVLYRRANPRNS